MLLLQINICRAACPQQPAHSGGGHVQPPAAAAAAAGGRRSIMDEAAAGQQVGLTSLGWTGAGP